MCFQEMEGEQDSVRNRSASFIKVITVGLLSPVNPPVPQANF